MQKFNFVPCVLYNFLIFVTSELLDAKTKESRFFLREFQLMASALVYHQTKTPISF